MAQQSTDEIGRYNFVGRPIGVAHAYTQLLAGRMMVSLKVHNTSQVEQEITMHFVLQNHLETTTIERPQLWLPGEIRDAMFVFPEPPADSTFAVDITLESGVRYSTLSDMSLNQELPTLPK